MATYNRDTNIFTLDLNEIEFSIPASIEGAETPTNSDVVGNAKNNILTGDGTGNGLNGGGGDDTLIGSGGEDFLDGGSGFDTVSYTYSTVGLTIDLNADGSTRPLLASPDSDYFESIEGVIGSNHNDIIVGTDAVGELLQGGGGSDNINGGGGNDTIIGGAGNDIMVGGAGIDTLSYANAATAVQIEMGSATGETSTYGGFGHSGEAEGDTNIGFEYLIGSRFGDKLDGNYGHNSIDGGAGSDSLYGSRGNDTLNGGAGTDIMQGGEDNDLYYVHDAMDEVRERSGEGYDTVITTVSFDLEARGDGAVEVLQAAAGNAAINLYGNSFSNFANRLIGNDGNNVLDGRKGADTMIGKGGDDTYFVDNGGDMVIEDSAAGGYDTVNTSVSYTLTNFVEALTATGSDSIALNGNALNNVITGNNGNNVIDGGIGADTMMGGAGDDIYYVDHIGDVVIDTLGNNTIRSTIDYKSSQFVGNVELVGSHNIEVVGNDLANRLYGNAGDNVISGGKGNDVLFGGGGRDSFVFDSPIGTWKTNKKINLDRIQDFTVKQDKILLDNKIFKKLGKGTPEKPGKLKSAFFEAGTKAEDRNDYLIYDKKKKTLSYDKDGSGGGKAVEIIKFDKGINLKHTDIWII